MFLVGKDKRGQFNSSYQMTNVHALDPVNLLLGVDFIGALTPQAESEGTKLFVTASSILQKIENNKKTGDSLNTI